MLSAFDRFIRALIPALVNIESMPSTVKGHFRSTCTLFVARHASFSSLAPDASNTIESTGVAI
jgi:hypothetical protein